MEYDVGAVVLGNWTIVEKIGEGGFGTVYRVEKNDADSEDSGTVGWFKHNSDSMVSALKVIKIPQSESEYKYILSELEDEASVSTHFEECVEKIKKEIDNMLIFQNNKHIVSYQSHEIIKYPDKIAWDILIRMELLTPLSDYINGNLLGSDLRPIDEKKIVRFGCDLCEALSVCHKKNILHRDLKPGNIFVDSNGNYKLGDFGVSRTIEGTKSGMSKAGTDTYMAPEVYSGNRYGFKSDIYSLGIVLYYLCNKKRLPFYPPYPVQMHLEDREMALQKRMSGKEPLPPPSEVSKELANVILKACAFNPDNRYQSADELLNALKNVGTPQDQKGRTPPGEKSENPPKPPPPPPPQNSEDKLQKKEEPYKKYYSMWKKWLIDLYGNQDTSKIKKLLNPPVFFDVGPKIDREILNVSRKYIANGDNVSAEDIFALIVTQDDKVFGMHGIIVCPDKIYISTYISAFYINNIKHKNYCIEYSDIKSISIGNNITSVIFETYSCGKINILFHGKWKATEFVKIFTEFLEKKKDLKEIEK